MTSVKVDHAGSVVHVTLDRPGARNALDLALLEALTDALDGIERDADARVVVLTGAGPAFCSGLDLVQLADPGSGLVGRAFRPWRHVTKPMIAAVNGPAVTGGLELALACDVVVASTRATFRDTHARVDMLPGWGLTTALHRRIGPGRALAMCLSGRIVAAEEALAWGLVDYVVAAPELDAAARALAADMAAAPPEIADATVALHRAIAESPAAERMGVEAEHHRSWLGRRFTSSPNGPSGR